MSTCCPSSLSSEAPNRRQTETLPAVHAHLHATDFAASVAFYRAFLGADPVKAKPGYAKFVPAWAPLNLAISQGAADRSRGSVSHLGIQVASPQSVRAHLERVRAAGLEVRVEMDVDCCHANQDKFWVVDPSGNEWEVYHLNYDLATDAASAEQSACCAG